MAIRLKLREGMEKQRGGGRVAEACINMIHPFG